MDIRFCRAVFTCLWRAVLYEHCTITLYNRSVRESVSRRKRVPCTCVNNGPREDDDIGPAETCYYIIPVRAVHSSCANCSRYHNKRIHYSFAANTLHQRYACAMSIKLLHVFISRVGILMRAYNVLESMPCTN